MKVSSSFFVQVAEVDDDIYSYLREGKSEKYLVAINIGQKEATVDFTASVGEPTATVVLTTPGM